MFSVVFLEDVNMNLNAKLCVQVCKYTEKLTRVCSWLFHILPHGDFQNTKFRKQLLESAMSSAHQRIRGILSPLKKS